MSIIHDALKRVQQSLSPKPEEPPAPPPSGTTQKGGSYLYETPTPAAEKTAPVIEHLKPVEKKPAIQNKIKSLLAFVCALIITAGAGWYVYQQFKNDVPRVQRLTQKMIKHTYYQLIHKEELPDFKTKAPEDLKPMAQITIPSTATPTSNIAAVQALPAPPPAPTTLNVHGIMSNASGNLALIDDQVYQEGDEVDGAKIIKIDLKSITVEINGTEKTIFVKN